MRFLLINDNPAVSRLIRTSLDKAGHDLDEIVDYGSFLRSTYDAIFVDSELYDDVGTQALKELMGSISVVYIGQRNQSKPQSSDFILEKPFLPITFSELVEKIIDISASKDDVFLDKKDVVDFDLSHENINNTTNVLDFEDKIVLDVKDTNGEPTEKLELMFDVDSVDKILDKDLFVDDLGEEVKPLFSATKGNASLEHHFENLANESISLNDNDNSVVESDDLEHRRDEQKFLLVDDALSEKGKSESILSAQDIKEVEELLFDKSSTDFKLSDDMLLDIKIDNKQFREDQILQKISSNIDCFDDDIDLSSSSIKEHINKVIKENIKQIVTSDDIINAISGMKVNITITFEEK